MAKAPMQGKAYNRRNLASERVEKRITVYCKLPVTIRDQLRQVVEADPELTHNALLVKMITKGVRRRLTQLNKKKNESTRDRLLREITQDT